MVDQSDFLPAERLSRARILGQKKQIEESPALTAMLDTSPGMVALLNQERQIVYCNHACASAGGLSDKSDAFGLRPGELLRCIHAAEYAGGCGTSESCRYCGLANGVVAGQYGSANSGECLVQCHSNDGETSTEFELTFKPVPEVGDGWLCCALTDISHEKRREALERTFFHDILNHAGAVQIVSVMLAEDDLTPEQRADYLGMLGVSARALVDEIHSHRTLLSAEKGDLAIEVADCDSLKSLRHAVMACQAFSLPEDKQVRILPGAQSVRFRTDATLLGRILINLLKNALEAQDSRAIVTVSCGIPVPGRVRFSVHNDSVMPRHVSAHVYQRSFSTKGTGRGLGTYSARLLTEKYLGGRAWFESAAGHGTTFHVEFAN